MLCGTKNIFSYTCILYSVYLNDCKKLIEMKRLDIPKKQLLNKHFSVILLFPHQEDRIWIGGILCLEKSWLR